MASPEGVEPAARRLKGSRRLSLRLHNHLSENSGQESEISASEIAEPVPSVSDESCCEIATHLSGARNDNMIIPVLLAYLY